MKRLFSLCLAIMLSAVVVAPASAQGWRGMARLAGTVVNADGNPIEGARVVLRSIRAGDDGPDVTTDRRGRWAALGLIGGQWNIDVKAEGYVTEKIVVNISEVRRIPPLEIVLQPMPEAEPEPEPTVASTVPPEAVEAVERGEALLAEGEIEAAIVELEKAHASLPDHLQLKQVLAQSYYKTGQLKPAIGLLRAVHQAEPTNNGVVLLLVNLLVEDGQLEEGRRLLDGLPAEAISEPTAVVNVGILFLNKNNPQEAHEYFTRAIEIGPDRGESYYYRALASIHLERNEEAKRDLRRVLELAPESSEAAEAKELLAALGG